MKTMIVDSHQHVMLPTTMQVKKMDDAGVDKAILFTTTPHVERAESATLAAIGAEMQVLYQLLSGSYSPETRISKMKDTILELNQAIQAVPDRFYGFGPVPLGLSSQATAEWVAEHIAGNGFKGIGEFTPGSETQIEQLEPVFKVLEDYHNLPIWVHTFNPVTLGGIKILRACLKSSNEDGNEGKRENLSRNIKFAFTIFPKSAEFVEPAEKTLYHPAAWQNDKLV